MYTGQFFFMVIVYLHLHLIIGDNNSNLTPINNVTNNSTKIYQIPSSSIDFSSTKDITKIETTSGTTIFSEGNGISTKINKTVPKKQAPPFPNASSSSVAETVNGTKTVTPTNLSKTDQPNATNQPTTIPTTKLNQVSSTSKPLNITNIEISTTSANIVTSIHKNNKTTTPKPKKPTITVTSDNMHIKIPPVSIIPPIIVSSTPKEQPKVEQSSELPETKNQRDYIIPVVVIIFTICIVFGVATVVLRKIKDYWMTRHYRRMDFLVDEMYND